MIIWSMCFGEIRVEILKLLLTTCVALDTLYNLSEPQSIQCETYDTFLLAVWGRLKEWWWGGQNLHNAQHILKALVEFIMTRRFWRKHYTTIQIPLVSSLPLHIGTKTQHAFAIFTNTKRSILPTCLNLATSAQRMPPRLVEMIHLQSGWTGVQTPACSLNLKNSSLWTGSPIVLVRFY